MAQSKPKIYVLLVFGTNDPMPGIKGAKDDVVKTLKSCGLSKENSAQIAYYKVLEGKEAAGENILACCKEMASAAGPNDTLFVYILAHGSCVFLDGDKDQYRSNLIHVLSPVAPNKDQQNLRKIGIKRYSIMKAMRGGDHRLNVLITDSCSGFSENPAGKSGDGSGGRGTSGKKLMKLLLNSHGMINWNSSNPHGGNDGKGELAFVFTNTTLFTRPFLDLAQEDVSEQKYPNGFTQEEFFRELGTDLCAEYKFRKQKARGTTSYSFFLRQDLQTLTEMDEFGRVKRPWNEKYDSVKDRNTTF